MKIKFLNPILAIIAITAITITACKKDDDKPDDNPTTPVASNLEVHFHSLFNGSHYEAGHNYTFKVADTTFTVTFNENTAFYVSGISLKKMNGGTTEFPDTYLLVKPTIDEYEVGELEAVHYTGISFNVGIDEETNHLDPSTYDSGHPLAPQLPSMHWDWNPGYRFLVMEGTYSDDFGGSGSFTYHIGLDEFLTSVTKDFHHHLEVTAGKDETIHMNMDYGKLLAGINLRTENFTKSMSAEQKPLTKKLVDNIAGAISID